MSWTRRNFLSASAGVAAPGASTLLKTVFWQGSEAMRPGERNRAKAIAFDAFVIFDSRPIAVLAESLFPGKGATFIEVWRTRQFEYCWLRTLTHQYADFRTVTEDALAFAAEMLKLSLSQTQRRQLMDAYVALAPWPDAKPALEVWKNCGMRMALLSNFTRSMLEANLANAKLNDLFERVLSADLAEAYKPDPRAYQLGIRELQLQREEILFFASSGWDAAGAKAFGYRTYWINRLGVPAEKLAASADVSGKDLIDVHNFVLHDRG